MRDLEFIHQTFQGPRLLDRIEVFTLDILDQGNGDCAAVIHLAHHCRDFVQTGQLRGTPATFTGDDLVAPGTDGPHHNGLHHTLLADGIRQILQGFLVHVDTWLVFTALNDIDRQKTQGVICGNGFHRRGIGRNSPEFRCLRSGDIRCRPCCLPQQGIQSPSQATFLC